MFTLEASSQNGPIMRVCVILCSTFNLGLIRRVIRKTKFLCCTWLQSRCGLGHYLRIFSAIEFSQSLVGSTSSPR